MDEVFGNSQGMAVADRERQTVIHRRLGLVFDTDKSGEKVPSGHEERPSDSKEE